MASSTRWSRENVGTEGAHRSELAGEVVLRHGSLVCKAQSPGASGKKGPAGPRPGIRKRRRIIISTPPHRSTRSFPKLFYPVLAETAGLESNTKSGRRRPQNRAQKPPGNRRRHGKADSPGRRVCEAPSSRMPAGTGLCPCGSSCSSPVRPRWCPSATPEPGRWGPPTYPSADERRF